MTTAARGQAAENGASPSEDGWWSLDGFGCVRYVVSGRRAGAALAAQVAAVVAGSDRRADLDLRGDMLGIRLDPPPPTPTDELADRISALAAAAAARPVLVSPQEVTLAVDVLDRSAVQPFWAAALAYVRRDPEHLHDPRGQGPVIYFQQLDRPRSQRNRVHVDVWVSRAETAPRVAAALAAGGTLVTDAHAPGWWVLADAEGNEVCIATREP